jgi:hypothetical protein
MVLGMIAISTNFAWQVVEPSHKSTVIFPSPTISITLGCITNTPDTMSLSQDAANLATLLAALTQPDTQAIRNAEATLKPFLKNPNSIPALFEVLAARGSQVSV